MKLVALPSSPDLEHARINDINYLLQQPTYKEERPCAGCEKPCPCSQSISCTCVCGPDCAHAPCAMSSDSVRYPIEEKIISLVFMLNCLRVCTPYWSCEGHQFPNGELFRVPQVWFYSRSMIYPKLIGEYVFKLKHEKSIHYPWHICIAYTDNSLETGFSIEPDVKAIENPELKLMQEDAQHIASNMLAGLKTLANKYAVKFDNERQSP